VTALRSLALLVLFGCSQPAKDELADLAASCGVSTQELRKAKELARASPVGRRVDVGKCWTEKDKGGEVFVVASSGFQQNTHEAA
jgi:hypothetical protein